MRYFLNFFCIIIKTTNLQDITRNRMWNTFLILIFLTHAAVSHDIVIDGQLLCNGLGHESWLQLWDVDNGLDNWYYRDDLLAVASSDPTGKFHIEGDQYEWGEFEPYLVIHHTCGSANAKDAPRCKRISFSCTHCVVDMQDVELSGTRDEIEKDACRKYFESKHV